MKQYTFKDGVAVAYDGDVYRGGDVIKLNDDDAKLLHAFLDGGTSTNEKESESDYDEMTVSELKSLAEEQGIEVKGNGNRKPTKSDYINALKDSE
ncbi:hypothetical protein NGB74_02475 [Staphylococcus chromogenes]|uniref:hypothetical protein n=1 Tax=Staphylococcus chromogenes TaxID=46126 RepID=UPI002DBB3D40|nr:hypothetical protein [Staphylococcus chromogenes]MEB7449875.1 hypothetical protein [Staphylococcus chromogenes]